MIPKLLLGRWCGVIADRRIYSNYGSTAQRARLSTRTSLALKVLSSREKFACDGKCKKHQNPILRIGISLALAQQLLSYC